MRFIRIVGIFIDLLAQNVTKSDQWMVSQKAKSRILGRGLPFQVRAEQPFVRVTFESFTSPKLHPTYSSSQTSRTELYRGRRQSVLVAPILAPTRHFFLSGVA